MQQYRKNLGKVSLTAEGAWNNAKKYDILSIVYDENTQHGFLSRQSVPVGVDLYNSEYWMPLNVSGYVDNNIIILSKKISEATIQSYTLEEAIASIKSVGRRPGAILGFYNENADRLDIGGRWELWQFNDTNVYNWENVDSWQNLYYNYNKFMGWFKDENFLTKYAPFPEIGCYAFVGSEFNEATVYRCDNKYVWSNTTQHAWDYVKVIVDGNVTVGENGNWFNNGEDTGIPASVKGENGKTPVFREKDNTIQYSFDSLNWITISDKVAAWFRWNATTGDTQANNVGRIQISRDKVTWTNLSGDIINNLHISRYIGVNESLPTSGIAEGTIYAKGPTYDTSDTSHANPIYRLWVYAWKGNTLAWQDNGEFTSIAAGVVQETGDSETEVMSQKAVSEKLSELDSKVLYDNPDFSITKMIEGGSSETTTYIYRSVKSGDKIAYNIISVNLSGASPSIAINLYGVNKSSPNSPKLIKATYGIGSNEVNINADYDNLIIKCFPNNVTSYNVTARVYTKKYLDIDKNKNLIDIVPRYFQKYELTDGYVNLNGQTNNVAGNYHKSNYIIIDRSIDLKINGITQVLDYDCVGLAFYNNKKEFISYIDISGYTKNNITTIPTSKIPDNAVYIKCTVPNNMVDYFDVISQTTIQTQFEDIELAFNGYKGNVTHINPIYKVDKPVLSGTSIKYIVSNVEFTSQGGSGAIAINIYGVKNGVSYLLKDVYGNSTNSITTKADYDYITCNYSSNGYVATMSADIVVYIGKIAELDNRLTEVENSSGNTISVWCPHRIFALNGTKLQIFKSNVALVYNPDMYQFDIKTVRGAAKGYNRDSYYEYDVNADNEDFTLSFGVKNELRDGVYSPNTVITHVQKKDSPSTNKNILVIGDSFTDDGSWVSELRRLLTGVVTNGKSDTADSNIVPDRLTNLTFIGTRDTDKTPNEGYSGMHYGFFATNNFGDNPFWNSNTNSVDFDLYCSKNGYDRIDYCIIILGTNGNTNKEYIDILWGALLTHNPNIKVLVGGRCFAAPFGAGTAGMNHNQTYLLLSNNVHSLNKELQAYCDSNEYKNNFLYVDYNIQLDGRHNMPHKEVVANQRSSEKIVQSIDNVHPAQNGYWQIADAFRAAFHYWCLE